MTLGTMPSQNLHQPGRTIFTTIDRDDRAAKMEYSGDGAYSSFESILSELWSKIVKPVLDRLDYQVCLYFTPFII